jgi:hypothetical protein
VADDMADDVVGDGWAGDDVEDMADDVSDDGDAGDGGAAGRRGRYCHPNCHPNLLLKMVTM